MIRQSILILWVMVTFCVPLKAQPYLIQGSIEQFGGGKIYLASFYGDRFSVIDSVESRSGSFHFLLADTEKPGIFRIIFTEESDGIRTENSFVELICNQEDLEVNITHGERGPVPYFEDSQENQVYFDFMSFQLEYESRLMEVYGQLFPANPGIPVYDSAAIRYEALQHQRNRFMDSLTRIHPDLYATKIMNAFRAPVVPGTLTHARRIDTLKLLFFQQAAMDDPSLLSAPVYTFRIVDYLSLHRVDTLTREQQEAEFIEAVDEIMVNTGLDTELRSFVVEFMLEGFELLGMEAVQVHLADHYLDESCASDVAALVRSRMEGYKKMSAGTTVPDFVIRDTEGISRRLSDLNNPYVLVMFWASSCVHCRGMIPEMRRWYLEENNLDLEVVAISIDSLESEFLGYAEEAKMPWITAHESLGWHSKVARDYHIYATPSMFLLDNHRTILTRPVHFRQFQRFVRKLER